MKTLQQELSKAAAKVHAGELTSAEKILLKINKRQAGIPDVLHMLGFIALETGRPRIAAKYLSDIAKRAPNNAGLLNLLGCAYYKDENFGEAIETFLKVTALAPQNLGAQFNLANALYDAGRYEEAAARYGDLLRQRPDDAESHNGLGKALLKLGERSTAIAAFSTALEITPDDPEFQMYMGAALAQEDQLGEAALHLERAVALDPEMVKAMQILAIVMLRMGRTDKAVSLARKALTLDADNAETHRVLGIANLEDRNFDDALKSLETARKLQPNDPETLEALAGLLEKSSKLDRASQVATDGLKAHPDHFGLKLIAGRIAFRSKEHEKALDIFLSMADDDQPLELRRKRYFELGRVYDRLGEADKAFDCFVRGNEAEAQSWRAQKLGTGQMMDYVARHLETFEEGWVSQWSPPFTSQGTEKSPVFMIGFPRSGTTLLDQILDSHSGIQVLEEPPTIDAVRSMLTDGDSEYPQGIATLSQQKIADLRQVYFDAARKFADIDERAVLVDKLPLNTVDVGLIYRLFPDAKFILSLRHPLDVCLSCFMQPFDLNAGMTSFLTLEDTAKLYAAVMRLWERYESLFPLKVHRIRYEDLVADLKHSAAAVLEFLDVPWDDAVLAYSDHAQERALSTPSYYQVTESIYTRARYRWVRYEEHLRPVFGTLRPFIEDFGYDGTTT